ncbi:MAG: CSLREA domain-containing protein, partial [Thermoanaerobaculia bacterium]
MRRFFSLLTYCLVLAVPLSAATFTVNDLGDASDAAPGNGVCATAGAVCTLRAAIEEANALAGPDQIAFSVAGTLSPATPYPSITAELHIDGTTAPGYAGTPVVIVTGGGSVATGFDLVSGSDNSQVLALQVHGFSTTAVAIASANAIVRKNYLGPIGGGLPNGDGLVLAGAADFATIGGSNAADGNVISGNTRFGVLVQGTNHTVSGNLIGTNAAGTSALPNGNDGVRVQGDTSNIVIGTPAPGAPNVISGNLGDGIELADTTGIVVAGNLIGVDITGATALGNGTGGLQLSNALSTSIGASTARNTISGNMGPGILVSSDSSNTTIIANRIGTNSNGTAPLSNTTGVIDGGTNTIIGSATGANVISGNLVDGVTEQPT